MSCNKISNLCADPTLSVCVDHEAPLGVNTKIITDCVNQSDVNTDLYAITDEVIENSGTSNLGNLCVVYPLTEGVITLKSVNEQNEIEICNLKTKVTNLETFDYSNLDITGFTLDFKCLADPCGDPITKLGQLLQIIIDKSCTI